MSSQTRKSISPLRAFFLITLISGVLAGCNSNSENFSDSDDSNADSQTTDPNSTTDGDTTDDPSDDAPETSDALPPQLADQTLVLQYQTSIAGSIAFSGSDDPDSDPQLSIITDPARGTLELVDPATGQFEYEPVDSDAWAGDSFTVQVDDVGLQSQVRTITLEFTDDTVPTLTLMPGNAAENVSEETRLSALSDVPIDPATLSYTDNGICDGSVQISSDNFASCHGIASHSIEEGNRLEFILATSLEPDTEYSWRITDAVASVFGIPIEEDASTFKTVPQALFISEVGASPNVNIMRWFELYNAGSTPLNLADYELRSPGVDVVNGWATEASRTFAFPNVQIAPGQYLVVRAQSSYSNSEAEDTAQVIHLDDEQWRPHWYGNGFLEINRLSDGATIDYVSFGSAPTPSEADAWTGSSVAALPTANDSFGQSIGRDAFLTDTDSAADWSPYSWATVGGPNDVCGTEDLDEDGIPDCNEQPGSTFAGMPLYEWGARAGRADIFLEVDYVDSTDDGNLPFDEGVQPRREALQKVIDAFAAKNIAVHIDAGDLYDNSPGLNPANFDLGGGQEVPYALSIDFSPTGSQASFFDYKASYFDYKRLPIFHFVLFSTSRNEDGSNGSSGIAEVVGNDLIVSLGSWGLDSTTPARTNALINYQASTLMHELGHNLGLLHGGDENVNAKPNYLSIMNYLYQLNGLPEIGNNEGDRYFSDYRPAGGCEGPLVDGPYGDPANFRMDFSDGSPVELDPANLDETLGLGRVGSDPVDFNCNGDVTETNVNASTIFSDILATGATTMTDHDDWGSLVIDFGGYNEWNNYGASLQRTTSQRQTNAILRFVGPDNTDRRPYIAEPSPPAALFERIRSHKVAP